MDQKLAADDFENAPTITLKIPIALPYQFHQTGFQKASGNFEYDGEFFNLVKQKIEGDTLYAVCIKNLHKTALLKKMSGFEKVINNWPATSSRTYNLINTFIKDYVPGNTTKICGIKGWTLTIPFFNTCLRLLQGTSSPLSPPPKVVA